MVDIQSVPAELSEEKKEDRRKKLQGENIMAPLLHRAALISSAHSGIPYSSVKLD